jgi:hypothetical protein
MQAIKSGLQTVRRLAQRLGPYVLLEILLPGGTLVALALFVYRNRTLPEGDLERLVFVLKPRLATFAQRGRSVLRRSLAWLQGFQPRPYERLESHPSR